MAGTVAPSIIGHRKRGLVRTDVVITTAADGTATQQVIGVGFGRLVGVMSKGPGAPFLTLKDTKTGATLLTHRPNVAVFGNTTTGDTTGGAAEDLFTTGAAHGLSALDPIVFTSITGGGGGVAINTIYYVSDDASLAATTFRLAANLVDAAAGTPVVNVGSSDISASTWYKSGATVTARHFRPTLGIKDNAGETVTADATAPNVNRDIFLPGKVSIAVAGNAGGATACTLSLIVDESDIGDLALTV